MFPPAVMWSTLTVYCVVSETPARVSLEAWSASVSVITVEVTVLIV